MEKACTLPSVDAREGVLSLTAAAAFTGEVVQLFWSAGGDAVGDW